MKIIFFYLSMVLQALLVLMGLPVLARHLLSHHNEIGLISDFAVGFVMVPLVLLLQRRWRWPIVLLWMAIHAGGYELFKSMGRLPAIGDLDFLFDKNFLGNTFSTFSPADFLYQMIFGIGSLILLLYPAVKVSRRDRAGLLGVMGCSAILFFMAHSRALEQEEALHSYSRFNPVHWMVKSFWDDDIAPIGEESVDILKQDLTGKRYLKKGKAKNVLVIALEGMTGSYLRQSRAYFDLPDGQTEMPLLSEWAENAMVIPDFIAHSHQTIRGLYALHCADLSKLSWTTPKATQIQSVPEKAKNCLPHQLKQRGFSTHFLQGAGLTFMGKDRFMPAIGFDEVHGLEWFPPASEGRVRKWGVDDQEFFAGASRYIDGLRSQKKPWFLSLLTVGTHQPYEVTDEFAAQYWDKKQASVAFLDQALHQFLTELKTKGVLDETLVIITADESHGSEFGDWASSWILNVVKAPEQGRLPKINGGQYGSFDLTLSILDYFDRNKKRPLPSIPGRSFFRKYTTPRLMVSFTADRLRWLDDDGQRIECTTQGKCQRCLTTSILGEARCDARAVVDGRSWVGKARWLDQNLSRLMPQGELNFTPIKPLIVARRWQDQWADNLSSAQYLDFPKGSKARVELQWTVLKAPDEGFQWFFVLKESERDLNLDVPQLSTLKTGESGTVAFEIDNPDGRQSFSLHLLAETGGEVRIDRFVVQTLSP